MAIYFARDKLPVALDVAVILKRGLLEVMLKWKG